MRLLFLNYECPPAGGGAGFASFALARELASFGHHVDLLTSRIDGALSEELVDGVHIRRVCAFRRNVHEVGMPGALSFIASAALVLPGLLRSAHYDVCHYYFGMPTGLLTRLPGVVARVPYVISLRGSDVPGYDHKLDRWHAFMRPVTERIWRNAAAVVANSDGLRALAQQADPECDIGVIHNGVDASPPRRFLRLERPLRVITVSRLIARKGIDTLIRAVAASPTRLDLVVVGDGPCRDALGALARELGVADRVQFLGFLSQAQIAAELIAADIFALASHSESCSMALLQAMGTGMPVLASRVGGNPELVNDGVNGLLFPVGDVDAVVRSLETLADRSLRTRFGRANTAITHNRHAWRVVAHRYETLLGAAAASMSRAGAPA